MRPIKQLKNLINFSAIPKTKVRVVLFSEGNNHWNFIKPVAEYLIKKKKELNPIFLTQSEFDQGHIFLKNQIDCFWIGSGAIRDYALNNIDCSVLLTSTPDIGTFQVKRSKKCKHYAYIQHSMNSLHMAYREFAFDEFDTVFCGGPHHEEEIKLICDQHQLQSKNTFQMRYEPVSTLRNCLTMESGRKSYERCIKKVLIAPTWGRHSIIESGVAIDYISELLRLGKSVTLRPHPETLKNSQNCVASIVKKVGSLESFHLDTQTEQLESLKQADLLVTDWSGVAFDFSLGLKRPTLFINTAPKVNNANFSKIMVEPIEKTCRKYFGREIAASGELESAILFLEQDLSKPETDFTKFYENNIGSTLDQFFELALD